MPEIRITCLIASYWSLTVTLQFFIWSWFCRSWFMADH